MSRRSHQRRTAPEHPRTDAPARTGALRLRGPLGGILLALAIAAAAFVIARAGDASFAAWARLGTEDVHALVFVGDDPDRLLFGHHGGILASSDGGRSWQPLPTRTDAMGLGASADGSIFIAGHEVFTRSADGGQTWAALSADLPSLDIHGFTRDPADPARMWTYLAIGGLWYSADSGLTWERVQEENVALPVAVETGAGTRLFGVRASGLAVSDDDGRSWQGIATPAIYPIASLAAAAGGQVLLAGGPGGLARSDDGGVSWSLLPFQGEPAAVAVTGSGDTIAIVSRSTEFFRSGDGGQSWPGP